MKPLRLWTACCTAIALLAGAFPVPAATSAPAAAGDLAPCHTVSPAPTSHNDHCAQGCDSTPLPDGSGPDWAPQTSRQPDLDKEPGKLLTPAYRREFEAASPRQIDAPPRAPPGAVPATPVTRCERLLN